MPLPPSWLQDAALASWYCCEDKGMAMRIRHRTSCQKPSEEETTVQQKKRHMHLRLAKPQVKLHQIAVDEQKLPENSDKAVDVLPK